MRAAIGSEALPTAGLTQREAEVIGLLARGSSNGDLATSLGISTRTAEKHVQNAFRKLGVTSRSQVWNLVGAEA